MSRVVEKGATQYDISVRSADGQLTMYRTLEWLSYRSAETVRGKGTRVWKATKLLDGERVGEPVALKDCWVDGSLEREAVVNAKVSESEVVANNPEYARFFLTTLAHGDVFVADKPDITAKHFYMIDRKHWDRRHEDHSTPYLVHYRIAFKEIGVPLREITSLYTVFSVLLDAVDGERF